MSGLSCSRAEGLCSLASPGMIACMYGDQYKGFMDFRSDSPDHDPRFALLYVVVVAVLLAVVLVRWLGWTWQTLATYLAVQSAVVGGWAYLRARSRRRRDERRIALREADRWA